MPGLPPTRDEELPRGTEGGGRPAPGLVRVLAGGLPALDAFPLVERKLVIGRAAGGGGAIADDLVSQRHAEVSFDAGEWTIADLASRNGTFLDGERITTSTRPEPRVLRVGQTLFLFAPDARRFAGRTVDRPGGSIVGPTLAEALGAVELAARTSDTLLVTGESGVGKELAARAFHAASPHARGPFVAVNCAAIPEGIAERLLFGAAKGAYSGATAGADGFLVGADGGTLFLDELGELDEAVQAKLLRAIETREVFPLGAPRARPVSFKLCAATNVDLRGEVAAGRFRRDLYFRIGLASVRLPALRERPEDVSWLLATALSRVAPGLTASARLVEACLLRPWPGNVRELMGEGQRAGHAAVAAGRTVVEPEDLVPTAGLELGGDPARGGDADARARALPDRAQVEEALAREGGNVSAAARALGLHRTQLRRLLEKLGIHRE